jgi:hypothetical protein
MRKRCKHLRHQRASIGQSVSGSTQCNNSNSESGDVLLMDDMAVHGQKDGELFLSNFQ